MISAVDRYFKISVDLNSDDVTYFMHPPDFFKGFYGIGKFGEWSFAFNSRESIYVYNFPAIDSLYIWTNDFKEERKVYAGSSFFDHPIDPIFSPEEFKVLITKGETIPQEEATAMANSRPIYHSIIHDPYRRLYYRFIGLPISESDISLRDPKKSRIRQYTILVLNESFKVIEELKLERFKYLIKDNRYFITDEGLHIQLDGNSEDIMEFDIFNIVNDDI